MTWTWVDRADDRSGLQWRFRETDSHIYIYIPGTDHVDDVRHHRKIRLIEAANGIWVTRADLQLAADIVRVIGRADKQIRIGGHSWGGAVAALAVWVFRRRGMIARGWLYGPKQAGNADFVRVTSPFVTAYRRRGDWIPMLMPWLASYKLHLIGRWAWPWKAHGPSTYYDWMEADGFR